MIESPATYYQLEKHFKKLQAQLTRYNDRLKKAVGSNPFSETELDEIVEKFDNLNWNMESRAYVEEQKK